MATWVQGEQLVGHGREGADLLVALPLLVEREQTRHDHLFVYIDPTAAAIDYIHLVSSSVWEWDQTNRTFRSRKIFLYVLPTGGSDKRECLKTSWVRFVAGSWHHVETPTCARSPGLQAL
jgi:hypothetical protein